MFSWPLFVKVRVLIDVFLFLSLSHSPVGFWSLVVEPLQTDSPSIVL